MSTHSGEPEISPILDVMRGRRSVRDFTSDPVPRESVARWLEAARWAPNHRLTEPWRFFILAHGGEKRARVAQLYRDYTYEANGHLPEEKRQGVAESNRQEVLDSPLFVYIYSVPGDNEEITRENYAAVACAMQNMQLAVHADGFGAGWSTGGATRHPDLAATLGADPSWDLVGALFIGRPSSVPRAQRSSRVEDCTTWL